MHQYTTSLIFMNPRVDLVNFAYYTITIILMDYFSTRKNRCLWLALTGDDHIHSSLAPWSRELQLSLVYQQSNRGVIELDLRIPAGMFKSHLALPNHFSLYKLRQRIYHTIYCLSSSSNLHATIILQLINKFLALSQQIQFRSPSVAMSP